VGNTTIRVEEYLAVLGGTLTRVDQPELPPIEITGEPLLVGRAPECGLVLDDPKVSSVHAEIVPTRNGVRVRDFSSRNGTFVDAARCTEVQLLGPSRLSFGERRLQKAYWTEFQRVCDGNIAKMSRVSGRSRPTVRETLERNGLGKYDLTDDE
jgi:pSer/pThr/pTyr-binding forkhead associated (FHA) protein